MLAILGLHDYLGLIAFVLSCVRYKTLRQFHLQGYAPFLGFTLFVEWGAAFEWFIINGSDHWIFNIYIVAEFCFYFFLFRKMLKNKKAKTVAFFGAILFPVVVVANCLFIKGGFNRLATYSIISGSLLIIAFACMYFYQLLQTPEKMKLFAIPFFWICTGLLFFYAGQFVIMAIFPYLAYNKDATFTQIFRTVVDNLNILLYCCFIIGFLCQRKITNSTSPSSQPPLLSS